MIKNHLGSNFVKSSKVPYSTDEKLEVQFFFVTKPDETIGYNNRGLKLLLVMKKKTLSRVKLRHRCLLAEKKNLCKDALCSRKNYFLDKKKLAC